MTIVFVTFAGDSRRSILGAYWFFVLRVDQSEEAALRKRLAAGRSQTQIPEAVPAAEADRATEQHAAARLGARADGPRHRPASARHHPGRA